MPIVVPLPLGGLGSEIGSINDRLGDLEARRLGATVVTQASQSVATGVTTSGPVASVNIASNGSALVSIGLSLPSSASVAAQLALTIDGNQVVTSNNISGNTSFPVPISIIWAVTGLSLGSHDFGMAFDCILSAFTASNLYVAVIPA